MPIFTRLMPIFLMVWLATWLLIQPAFPDQVDKEELLIYYTNFPPFVMHDETANGPEGILIDNLIYILDAIDINYTMKFYPPKRYFQAVIQGTAMYVSTFRNFLNDDLYYVSETPVASLSFSLYWKKGTKPASDILTLQGGKLATIFGYTYGGFLNSIQESEKLKIISMVAPGRSLDLLMTGRVKYLLNYSATMKYHFTESQMAQLESSNIGEVKLYMGVRKNIKNSEEIFNRVNLAFIEAKRNGIIDEAYTRYSKR